MIQKPDRKEGCKTSTMTDRNITTEETSSAFVASPEPLYGSFVFGVALTFATRVLMLAGVFIAGVIVARSLGPEGFGAFAVLNVTVALALQMGSAGIESVTASLAAAQRVGEQIGLAVESQAEVERMLRDSQPRTLESVAGEVDEDEDDDADTPVEGVPATRG